MQASRAEFLCVKEIWVSLCEGNLDFSVNYTLVVSADHHAVLLRVQISVDLAAKGLC